MIINKIKPTVYGNEYIILQSGNKFRYRELEDNIFTIDDIARSLSRMPRYAGHTKEFYSVAEHCVLMSKKIFRENILNINRSEPNSLQAITVIH